jgi:hypothetical protein
MQLLSCHPAIVSARVLAAMQPDMFQKTPLGMQQNRVRFLPDMARFDACFWS